MSAHPNYCVFATHYANIARFQDLAKVWDRRDPGRSFAKALEFSRIYVDFIHRYLGTDVQIVFVDSSPLDLAAFLRQSFPDLEVEQMSPQSIRPTTSPLVCLEFPDNIGHLSVNGRDGWGRACMAGLEFAMRGVCEYVAHVEADLLVKGEQWLPRYIAENPQADIIAPRMHIGIETGLFIARTQWIRESKFIDRYAWHRPSGQKKPEARFASLAGRGWALMNIPGGRGELTAVCPGAVRGSERYYLTHATAAEWQVFLEETDYALPDVLQRAAG